VTVHDRTFDPDTMKRMLDFMYDGEYSVHSDGTPTKMCVLTHLFCYAIGDNYVAKNLSDYALAKFDEALLAITPKDFGELVGVIGSQTDALLVHRSLRNAAFARLDELAENKSFVNVIGGKHLLVQKDEDNGETVYRNLQAAIQLATFSANLFRSANQTKSRTATENARLSRKLEETLDVVELFRRQVIRSSTSLHKSEDAHGTATEAIKAALNEAQQAKKELFKVTGQSYLMSQDLKSTKLKLAEVEDQAASAAQALKLAKSKLAEVEKQATKTKLELELLQNEGRNNRQASVGLGKSNPDAATSLKQREQQLEHLMSTSKGDQRRASLLQKQAEEEKRKASQDQVRYQELQSQLLRESEQIKPLLEDANEEVQRLLAENKILREQAKENTAASFNQAVQQHREEMQGELSQVKRELAEANKETQRLMAETKARRDKGKENSALLLNQATASSEYSLFQQKTSHAQQVNTLHHSTQQVHDLQAELNRANLWNFTMQRTIDDLHDIILNDARDGKSAPSVS
jgi:chromosome segregation ATPase